MDEKEKEEHIPELGRRVWIERDGMVFLRDSRDEKTHLENAVYILQADMINGKYLRKISDDFQFNYKLYGLENKLINRVIKTYKNSKGNLGVLLNGLKGTGKTVTSKILCNNLEQPVILVDSNMPGCHIYLNAIPQDITIFIDEYEKIFENDADMLTIMDGALNSPHRRVFVLTTNKLHVNENLLQRPGRIRYLKQFKDLSPAVIREILNDILIPKQFLEQTVLFISSLELITVDIVKAIAHEVNVHEEPPSEFADVFNVRQITGKYDIYVVSPDKTTESLFKKGVRVGPRKDFDPLETPGSSFSIDGDYYGTVIEALDSDTIKVRLRIDKKSRFYPLLVPYKREGEAWINKNFQIIEAPDDTDDYDDDDDMEEGDMAENTSISDTKEQKQQYKEIWAEVIFRISHSWTMHKTYNWDPSVFGLPV